MSDRPKNMGASVRGRLFNLSRETGRPLYLLLTRYALERLLYRLGESARIPVRPQRHDADDQLILRSLPSDP